MSTANKKSTLGRNLDALLSSTEWADRPRHATGNSLQRLSIDSIQPGKAQPRRTMNDQSLQELAESIKRQGIIQPIVVRPFDEQTYEIIAGERRWRAARIAGLDEIPVVIQDVTDSAAMAVALVENIQREDLNPLELAKALQRLLSECHLTQQQVAQTLGKSRSTITNLLRLLNLDEQVQALLVEHSLEMGHARALLALTPVRQRQAAKLIVAKGLSVREAERLVKRLQVATTQTSATGSANSDPNIRQLENDLAEKLCAKTVIQHRSGGKGKLVVYYHSLDELKGIMDHIQ